MNNIVPYGMELPAVPEPSAREHQRSEGSSLRYFVGILMSRARLAVGVAIATLFLVVVIGLQIPRSYYAEGSLLIQPRRANLTQTQQPQPNMLPPDTSAVDTEVELLRSRAVAEAVATKLKLYDDPEFNPALKKEGRSNSIGADIGEALSERVIAPVTGELRKLAGANDTDSFVGDQTTTSEPGNAVPSDPNSPDPQLIGKVTTQLQRQSSIRRVGLTYVVHVGFSASSSAKAERIANAFIDAYVAQQLGVKVGAVAKANEDLDQGMAKLRQDALEAEAKLQEYKNANNLMSVEGATMAESEVSNLNRQIADAKADRAEKEARVAAAYAQIQRGSGGADVVAALGSETIKELRKSEAEKSAVLAQLTSRFKADYPEVKRTQAEVDDIHHQIQLEINRIFSGLRSEAQAANQREQSLLDSRLRAQNGLSANNRARVGLVALQQRADASKKIYENYLNRASELAVERSLQQADATVNYKAAVSTSPLPNLRLILAVALFLAILSGMCAILLSELWSRRVRSRTDVERDMGVPLAGVLPDFRSVARLKLRRSIAGPADHLVEHPFTAFAEAFRNLRAHLKLSTQAGPSKIIAITSAVPREGKSMTSLCLARTMALTGSSVVLVDCDLRQRGVTKLIGDSDVGIREVVENNLPLQQAMIKDVKTNAWILPAARRRAIPQDLFGRPKTDELLHILTEKFDYVILDTPPLLGMADARMLVSKADRVLYVVQWNKTPTATARAAIEILKECGARMVGTLLTKVNVRQQARYGYGDGSDYFHSYRRYYLTGG
jgi:capsular exopolysaccharide synthesis family protein